MDSRSTVAKVIQTNDHCTVSKRSVEALYYPKPHFYRYFVKKKKTRAPLVNRGYWLRMQIIERNVKKFLYKATSARKVIINLGCGYDALPFHMLARERQACQGTTFVDVDYPPVVENKANVIRQTHELSDLLDKVLEPCEDSHAVYRSENYVAIGTDLGDLDALKEALEDAVPRSNCTFLVMAEVSLTYMTPHMADQLISWAAGLGPVQFFMLEQMLPRGPEYPFAKTMLNHYQTMQSPLLCIDTYPRIQDQVARFLGLGWEKVEAKSLWGLWSDREIFSSHDRIALQAVEAFDEWEDFALFATHYFFLSACNSAFAASCWSEEPRHVVPRSVAPDCQMLDGSSHARNKSKAVSSPQRSHGAIYQVDDGVFEYSGGYDGSVRLQDTITYTANGAKAPNDTFPHVQAKARLFHTVTALADFNCLLVGGRSAPGHGYSDCWIRRDGQWSMADPLPCPLYRHSATKVNMDVGREAVLVYGGKSSNEVVSNAWLLWEDGQGWIALDVNGITTTPCFGALITTLENDKWQTLTRDHPHFANHPWGILGGGMAEDGTVLTRAFLWAVDGGKVLIQRLPEQPSYPPGDLCRYGAKLAMAPTCLCIVGGISSEGLGTSEDDFTLWSCESEASSWIEPNDEQDDRSNKEDSRNGEEDGFSSEKVEPNESTVLFGHSVIWDGEGFAILGGGATCFTCGTYMNSIIWRMRNNPMEFQGPWRLVTAEASRRNTQGPVKRLKSHGAASRASSTKSPPMFRYAERGPLSDDSKGLTARVLEAIPRVFEHADFGTCTYLWTTEYLKRTIGFNRVLEVHECPEKHMVFASKNFSIKHRTCEEFIKAAVQGQPTYLRSIGAKDRRAPANFHDDFPSLAADFHLPRSFPMHELIVHSSVLRISGQVNMWLHYDVMPNLLFQIRGSKRLILFPPSDVLHLDIPSGGSSTDLNVFAPRAFEEAPLIDTSPYEVILKAGETLFIPSLWCHAAAPLDGFSVAVNVFFRTKYDNYAFGNDIYGNRDIDAYADARQDVAKALERFRGIPTEMKTFYLSRLVQEFQEKVDSTTTW